MAQKASLTTSQGVSAIIAGIVGHLLFSLAWFTLVIGVVGLIAKGLIFGLIDSFVNQIELTGEAGAGALGALQGLRAALDALSLIVIIGSLVSIVVAFLISGAIMKAGKVRKPWGATISAMLIVGFLDLGLFWVYLFIASSASDSTGFFPTYPIVAIIGTIVVGALVWLWMAHVRRPLLSEVEAAPAVPAAPGAAPVAPAADAPVLDASAAPPADAPVVDPTEPALAEPAPADAVPAEAAPAEVAAAEPVAEPVEPAPAKPTAKKTTTKKAPAAKPPAEPPQS